MFKVKYGPTNKIKRFRARLVAQGFSQKFNINYKHTHSPVASLASIRSTLALAAQNNWEIHHIDISSAYLHTVLTEKLYIRRPQGFKLANGKIIRLHKALYGTKQAGRQWYYHFTSKLMELGLTKCIHDPCMFYHQSDSHKIIVPVYVDDSCVTGFPPNVVKDFINRLKKVFKITVEPIEKIVGMEVNIRKNGDIFLHQNRYIQMMKEKFKVNGKHKMVTPLPPHFKIQPVEKVANKDRVANVPHASLVGSIMYAAVATRLEIFNPLLQVSRFMHNPTLEFWQTAVKILNFLIKTSKEGILFKRKETVVNPERALPVVLNAYSDSDFANCTVSRRSISAYVVYLNDSPISWTAKMEKTICLDVSCAEYFAATRAAKELMWLKNLLISIGYKDLKDTPPFLYIDNTSTIQTAMNDQILPGSKHLQVRFLWLKQNVQESNVRLQWVPTKDNPADILTKNVTRSTYLHLISKLRGNDGT